MLEGSRLPNSNQLCSTAWWQTPSLQSHLPCKASRGEHGAHDHPALGVEVLQNLHVGCKWRLLICSISAEQSLQKQGNGDHFAAVNLLPAKLRALAWGSACSTLTWGLQHAPRCSQVASSAEGGPEIGLCMSAKKKSSRGLGWPGLNCHTPWRWRRQQLQEL